MHWTYSQRLYVITDLCYTTDIASHDKDRIVLSLLKSLRRLKEPATKCPDWDPVKNYVAWVKWEENRFNTPMTVKLFDMRSESCVVNSLQSRFAVKMSTFGMSHSFTHRPTPRNSTNCLLPQRHDSFLRRFWVLPDPPKFHSHLVQTARLSLSSLGNCNHSRQQIFGHRF